MLVRAKEMLSRVTGFSTPVFGVSWNPSPSDRDAVRKFLVFLEDSRALFNPFSTEVEDHVVGSILNIRRECVTAVGTLSEAAKGAVHVRAIGAACRRFLDEPHPTFEDIMSQQRDPDFQHDQSHGKLHHGTHPVSFFTALGELRASVGMQIAMLSSLYDIDIHGELARILPAALDE